MPLTVPDPDLEIMGAGEGREGAGHPGPQFALKIRGVAPPQTPPLDPPLANVSELNSLMLVGIFAK